jgi:hypothetical protein
MSAYGAEVLIGLSISPNERLRQHLNDALKDTAKFIGEGRTYSLTGSIPTVVEWKKPATGWFVGFSVSTETLKKLISGSTERTATSTSTQSSERKSVATSARRLDETLANGLEATAHTARLISQWK